MSLRPHTTLNVKNGPIGDFENSPLVEFLRSQQQPEATDTAMDQLYGYKHITCDENEIYRAARVQLAEEKEKKLPEKKESTSNNPIVDFWKRVVVIAEDMKEKKNCANSLHRTLYISNRANCNTLELWLCSLCVLLSRFVPSSRADKKSRCAKILDDVIAKANENAKNAGKS